MYYRYAYNFDKKPLDKPVNKAKEHTNDMCVCVCVWLFSVLRMRMDLCLTNTRFGDNFRQVVIMSLPATGAFILISGRTEVEP